MQHDGQNRLPHPNSDVGIKNVMYAQIYHLNHSYQISTNNSNIEYDPENPIKDPRKGITHVRSVFNQHELINEVETHRQEMERNRNNSTTTPSARRQYLPNCVTFAPNKTGLVNMMIGLSNGKVILQSAGLNILQEQTLKELKVIHKNKNY